MTQTSLKLWTQLVPAVHELLGQATFEERLPPLAAGQAPLPGGDTDGARALRRGPHLARVDQLPCPGHRQADPGQERGPRAVARRGRDAPEAAGVVDQGGMAWLRQAALPTPSQDLRRDLLLEE